jgi:formylglycine-generating enzyme required for sulfatase activity
VSIARYLEFLAAAFDPDAQSPECTWNQSFLPPSNWPPPQGEEERPVAHVDWCDARAYCEWAGKRLCGRIGGGPNEFTSYKTVDKSEWYLACGGETELTYPYGSTYDPLLCNGSDFGASSSLPVPASVSCVGATAGLFDMSGNVHEWTDECEDSIDRSAQCRRRGGSFFSELDLLRCAGGSKRARDFVGETTGIRCCADPG